MPILRGGPNYNIKLNYGLISPLIRFSTHLFGLDVVFIEKTDMHYDRLPALQSSVITADRDAP